MALRASWTARWAMASPRVITTGFCPPRTRTSMAIQSVTSSARAGAMPPMTAGPQIARMKRASRDSHSRPASMGNLRRGALDAPTSSVRAPARGSFDPKRRTVERRTSRRDYGIAERQVKTILSLLGTTRRDTSVDPSDFRPLHAPPVDGTARHHAAAAISGPRHAITETESRVVDAPAPPRAARIAVCYSARHVGAASAAMAGMGGGPRAGPSRTLPRALTALRRPSAPPPGPAGAALLLKDLSSGRTRLPGGRSWPGALRRRRGCGGDHSGDGAG